MKFYMFGRICAALALLAFASPVFAQAPTPYSPAKRATYTASISAFAPASATTDFFTLTGSATAPLVRILRVECSGISTAAATATIEAVLRSTADTGTPTALTAVPSDSSDAAAGAVAVSYAANPTTGTLIGRIRTGKLTTGTAATSAFNVSSLVWNFGAFMDKAPTLRGASQVFALNGVGGTFSAGTALNCEITWIEG